MSPARAICSPLNFAMTSKLHSCIRFGGNGLLEVSLYLLGFSSCSFPGTFRSFHSMACIFLLVYPHPFLWVLYDSLSCNIMCPPPNRILIYGTQTRTMHTGQRVCSKINPLHFERFIYNTIFTADTISNQFSSTGFYLLCPFFIILCLVRLLFFPSQFGWLLSIISRSL